MTEVTNNELADAIEKADWSNSSIGNKLLLLLAVSRLRNTPSVSDSAGWIEWNGGECPLRMGTTVDITYRNGVVAIGVTIGEDSKTSQAFWDQDDHRDDIVAYRISK